MGPFYVNRGRLTWAVNLIRLNALAAVVDLLAQFQGLKAIHLAQGIDGEVGALELYNVVSALVGRFQILLLLAAGIAFLLWWHRSVVNLSAAGPEVSATPGWAVGMWLVPIVSLYLPYLVVKEAAIDETGEQAPNLPLWWGAWIVGTLSTNLAARLALADDTLARFQTVVMLYVLADAATVASALLVIPIMQFIQERQERLAQSANATLTPTAA